jgi:DNA-binding NarL/FixJ family response regulator
MNPVHLKVIHRNRIFRECLAEFLSKDDKFVVESLCHSRSDDLLDLEVQQPCIVLVDMNLPGRLAFELTRKFCSRHDGTKVVLLTHSNVEEELLECLEAGAAGCILEESSLKELQFAIQHIARGETFCSPSMVHTMFTRLAQGASAANTSPSSRPVALTTREREILRLIADDLGNKQIARKLSLSLFTIKNHVHHILEKLKVSTRSEAVQYARKRCLLSKSRDEVCAGGAAK